MKLVAMGLALLLLIPGAGAEDVSPLPSFAHVMDKKQFPSRPAATNTLTELVKYRADLECFREVCLEGYNQDVIEYIEELVAADKKLELDIENERVSRDVYTKRHKYLQEELAKTQGRGEYMRPYFDCLKTYRGETSWVLNQIRILIFVF